MKRIIQAAVALGATLAIALVGLSPAIVSGHTPSAYLVCSDGEQSPGGLHVSLVNYNGTNGVQVKVDGVLKDGTPKAFGSSYSYNSGPLDPFVGHTAQVIVLAHDDLTGSHGWSKTFNLTLAPCQEQPTPTPTPTPQPDPPKFDTSCGAIEVSGVTEGWQFIVEPGDMLLGNGITELTPGEYTYGFRFDGNDIDSGSFTIEPCPTPTPTATPEPTPTPNPCEQFAEEGENYATPTPEPTCPPDPTPTPSPSPSATPSVPPSSPPTATPGITLPPTSTETAPAVDAEATGRNTLLVIIGVLSFALLLAWAMRRLRDPKSHWRDG